MQPLFAGEPDPPPEHVGPTWTIRFDDEPAPAPVRHAAAYEPFVALAILFGTDPRNLFDLWTFAHFVRAHRDRFAEDAVLLHAAVVFLGNVCIANHPECFWTNFAPGLAVQSQLELISGIEPVDSDEKASFRYLGVGGTVPAVLAANEERFLEFQAVVNNWKPGAAPPPSTRTISVVGESEDRD